MDEQSGAKLAWASSTVSAKQTDVGVRISPRRGREIKACPALALNLLTTTPAGAGTRVTPPSPPPTHEGPLRTPDTANGSEGLRRYA